MEHAIARVRNAKIFLAELALGGTAVGTGINTHVEFASRAIAAIASETGLPLVEAPNHFEAQSAVDACVETSGALKGVAVSLTKIANDIRWLASGPRCGLGELKLPATQPGSSIMPGKVNPVICEMVIQVAAQVIGNDATITFGGTFGFFELNTMLPVVGYNLLQSIDSFGFGRAHLHGKMCGGVGRRRDPLRSERGKKPGYVHRACPRNRLRQSRKDCQTGLRIGPHGPRGCGGNEWIGRRDVTAFTRSRDANPPQDWPLAPVRVLAPGMA